MPDNQLQKFMQLTKVDVSKRLIYGVFTAEQPDKSGEVADYETTKAAFQAWSSEIQKVSGGKSMGNIRKMHGNEVVGKAVEITFDDVNKVISGCVEVNQQTVEEADKGYLNGFSLGGSYARKWSCPVFKGKTRFTPVVAEVSVVDNPCVPDAVFNAIKDASFQVVKADGSMEMRKFAPKEIEAAQVTMFKATDGSLHESKEAAVTKNAEIIAAKAAAPALAALEAVAPEKKVDAVVNEALKKAMHHVSHLAGIVNSLSELAKGHEAHKGEGHPITEKLKKHVRGLSDTMHAMAGDEAENMNDMHEACKLAGVTDDENALIKKALEIGKTLEKFQETISTDAATLEALQKITAERDALGKVLAELPSKIEQKFDAMQKRLAHLEAQPAADGVVLTTLVKGGDVPAEQEKKNPPVSTLGSSPAGFRAMLNR